jgi:hypothetical protein
MLRAWRDASATLSVLGEIDQAESEPPTPKSRLSGEKLLALAEVMARPAEFGIFSSTGVVNTLWEAVLPVIVGCNVELLAPA